LVKSELWQISFRLKRCSIWINRCRKVPINGIIFQKKGKKARKKCRFNNEIIVLTKNITNNQGKENIYKKKEKERIIEKFKK